VLYLKLPSLFCLLSLGESILKTAKGTLIRRRENKFPPSEDHDDGDDDDAVFRQY